ncbi:hypothetical protein BFW38_15200 [Terasakiispira papahanaumokuakeensis]|uniref:Cell shape determination protein CcmA n=1 Tax=Terasakiispira papahanaumokuakeensis TaxID=197479 RepID=A0A1E2VCU3_9GAMM|nr:polymer-forming cytoskeletal protein [Terasakiispira papahanaumokuakeensis]ODC04672.1 hypothetical protein BFW38_15200 [Terasakiispira papahanaumokuakeensis]
MFGKNPPSSNHFDTLISGKAEIVGDIHFSGGLHIDGKVFGNIIAEDDSKAVLRISDHGSVEGEISVPHVVINGAVVGDIHACEHLELAGKAVVKGNIHYNTIEMVMGAQVDGQLNHRYRTEGKNSERPPMPKHVTREKPVSALDKSQDKGAAVKPADKKGATATPEALAKKPMPDQTTAGAPELSKAQDKASTSLGSGRSSS